MTDHIAHAAGVLSLLVFAGAGIAAIVDMTLMIRSRWARIRRLAAGFVEPPAVDPDPARKHELSPRLVRSHPHG